MKIIPPRRAFTLLEMLTVVGIIALLATILLPVISRVRNSARNADTSNTIAQIFKAIEQYKQDQGAYPGPLPNSDFSSNSGTSTSLGMTMTENMVLGLCGGYEVNPTVRVEEKNIGLGPMTLGPRADRQRRFSPYLDPSPGQLTPTKLGDSWGANGKAGVNDSNVPEFMDRFAEAKPIIFLRANVGGFSIVKSNADYGNNTYPLPAKFPAQYELQWLRPYVDPASGSPPKTPFSASEWPSRTVGLMTVPAGPPAYFTQTSILDAARGQNGFLLISAGLDGIYGTSDDIISP